MKRILPEFEFSTEQLNNIRNLAAECGLCEDTVKILYGRGICTGGEIMRFINPSFKHFIDPFKMGGMDKAAELIKRARDEEWCVLVYGDYDADGVCAATIMGNALRDFGIEPILAIPERADGYGLSIPLLDNIFEEYYPQLVITVDCGISCAEEVEYIKESGAEIIVTDHHELPEKIPDCICINPKFSDDYPYDNLCGAGVAFKVACALLGEKAYKYLDFAAIATVADSVPLTGENRDIVYEGLKLINSKPKLCYSQFFKQDAQINSQSLAFSVAPKINAAGRMGDAKAALDLFNEQDENIIFDLAAKLTAYNLERQKYCDELYASAKKAIVDKGTLGKIILLCNEGWNAGFVGIVAARLADEFCRPAILFVKHGDMLRGSARSVEGVNIYEALRACSDYIEEFGGHSQAAGVNITADNFEPLRAALEKYMAETYSEEDFIPTVYISSRLKGEYSQRFARELEMLEPFGVGNRRPVFLVESGASDVRPVKQSTHLSIKSKGIELMYFGGGKYLKLIESAAPKKFIFEYNVSSYRGKEYVKGFVRDILYENNAGAFASEEIAINGITSLSLPEVKCDIKTVSQEDISALIENCPSFGTLFIAYDYSTIAKYPELNKMEVDLFVPSAKNFVSSVLISPQPDCDLSGYKTIVILEKTEAVHIRSLEGKTVYVSDSGSLSFVKKLSVVREELLFTYSKLISNCNSIKGADVAEAAKNNYFGCSTEQAVFALSVFRQLSLISFEGGKFTVFRGVKTDLNASSVYTTVKQLIAEACK